MSKDVSSKRQEMLEKTMKQLAKDFGEGTVMIMGDAPTKTVDSISTGSLTLDVATGIGGFPRGRISEIYAQESAGKTTTTLHAIANCQRNGGIAAFIDAEHALDIEYARTIGVDIDTLIMSQPDNGEQALEIVDKLVSSGVVDLVVVDSVSALTPRAEIEGSMGDVTVALQARLMSQALRKITGTVSATNTALVFINQLRDKIQSFGFGDPTTTSGGKALKFYASLRIKLQRTGSRKQSDEQISNNVKFKIEKNKMAAPFKTGVYEIMFNGKGIDRNAQILELGQLYGIISKSGSSMRYHESPESDPVSLGMGFPKAMTFLEDNPKLANDLWAKIATAEYAKIDRDASPLFIEDDESVEEATTEPVKKTRGKTAKADVESTEE